MLAIGQGSVFGVWALVIACALPGDAALALTAAEYQGLRSVWKLGYVVGLAHGRALYRDGRSEARDAVMDRCIPKISDTEIVAAVEHYLAANANAGSRPAADVIIDAIAAHCGAK